MKIVDYASGKYISGFYTVRYDYIHTPIHPRSIHPCLPSQICIFYLALQDQVGIPKHSCISDLPLKHV